MITSFEQFSALVSDALIKKYGVNSFSDTVFERIIEFAADTEIRSAILESLDEPGLIESCVEYNIEDTPFTLLEFDTELLEASLNFLYGAPERKYRKDKNGKIITGMNKEANRYTGSKKERDRKKAKAYYDRPGNREKQNARMRKRYRALANDKASKQSQKDRDEAERSGKDLSTVVKQRKAAARAKRAEHRRKNQDAINARAAHTRSKNEEKNKARAEERRRKRQSEKKK